MVAFVSLILLLILLHKPAVSKVVGWHNLFLDKKLNSATKVLQMVSCQYVEFNSQLSHPSKTL